MTDIPGIIIQAYSFLLRLYPGSFRRNFEEQMLLDFSDLAADASRRGKWGLTFFCLRELIDFPVNLLEICLEKESLNPVFRPGAGRNILRIALAFGLAFALNNFVGILAFARQ
ncbi:MAG TPA: hypothetical protein VKP08_13760, partial [Anaerolineales bacterium]|nr:hypothetical protein [Anaerolineales bacterium]